MFCASNQVEILDQVLQKVPSFLESGPFVCVYGVGVRIEGLGLEFWGKRCGFRKKSILERGFVGGCEDRHILAGI